MKSAASRAPNQLNPPIPAKTTSVIKELDTRLRDDAMNGTSRLLQAGSV
ncbi:hypothetical protein [Paracoccus methylarcula]|nr:hypothetical protein [Paracoccus methylarcula]